MCSITSTSVIEALSHLKLDKSDRTTLISNHLICALSSYLSNLFTDFGFSVASVDMK